MGWWEKRLQESWSSDWSEVQDTSVAASMQTPCRHWARLTRMGKLGHMLPGNPEANVQMPLRNWVREAQTCHTQGL